MSVEGTQRPPPKLVFASEARRRPGECGERACVYVMYGLMTISLGRDPRLETIVVTSSALFK